MKKTFKTLTVMTILAMLVPNIAFARSIFNTDEWDYKKNGSIQLDEDGIYDNLQIQFGPTMDAYFRFNVTNDKFEVGKNIDFQQNQAENLVIHSGTSFPASPVAGQKFFRTDEGDEYIYDGTEWVKTTSMADSTEDDFLHSDETDNYESGTLTFDNGTTLDMATGSSFDGDDADIYIDGVQNTTFTIDEGNTGGDVSLEFGNSLQAINWDNANQEFDFTDSVNISGDLTVQDNAYLQGDTSLGGTGDTVTFETGTTIDFSQNQAENFVFEQGTVFPTSPVDGQAFYNTDDDSLYLYDATSATWINVNVTGDYLLSNDSDFYESGTLTFNDGTTLDLDDPGVAVRLAEIKNELIKIGGDNTGGDVTLQFGDFGYGNEIKFDSTEMEFDINTNTEVNGQLEVYGDEYVYGGLTVTDSASIQTDLDVGGVAHVNYDLTVGQNVDITNDLQVGDNVVLGDNASDQLEINGTISSDVNFGQNQAVNFVLEKGTAFPSSPVAGQKYYRTDLNKEYFYNGTSWISSSTGSTTQSSIHSAEYKNATFVDVGRGSLYSDHDDTDNMNYYNWNSRRTSLQDTTVALELYLPDNFDSWDNTNPIQIRYRTNDATSSNNKVDIELEDTAGVDVTVSNGTDLTSTTWSTANVTFNSASGTWTPGDKFTLFVTLSSRNNNSTYIGDVIMNYNVN